MNTLLPELRSSIILRLLPNEYRNLCMIDRWFAAQVHMLALAYKVFQTPSVHACMMSSRDNGRIDAGYLFSFTECNERMLTFRCKLAVVKWSKSAGGVYQLTSFTYNSPMRGCKFIVKIVKIMHLLLPDYKESFEAIDPRKCCSCDECKCISVKFVNITPWFTYINRTSAHKYVIQINNCITGLINTSGQYDGIAVELPPDAYMLMRNGNYQYLLNHGLSFFAYKFE